MNFFTLYHLADLSISCTEQSVQNRSFAVGKNPHNLLTEVCSFTYEGKTSTNSSSEQKLNLMGPGIPFFWPIGHFFQ